MENSPWLDPKFLLTVGVTAVAFIAWLLRGEFKSNANSTRQEEYEEQMNERVGKLESNHEKVKGAFYAHATDTKVHHNEAMFTEFRQGLERRFNTVETTLNDIKGLIIQNHKDR